MYADDVVIYTTASTGDDLLKSQRCVDNIYQWYFRNKLPINKTKFAVLIIGSKMQLESLNLDQLSMNLESNTIELINRAKYLRLLVNDYLSRDDHILQLCRNMNFYLHVLRRLNKIFPKQLLLKVSKSYIQSKLDYGLSLHLGCTTEVNLDRVQRIQNPSTAWVQFNHTNHNYICAFAATRCHRISLHQVWCLGGLLELIPCTVRWSTTRLPNQIKRYNLVDCATCIISVSVVNGHGNCLC